MKKIVSFIAVCMIAGPVVAAPADGRGRATMTNQIMSAPRQTASVNQLNTAANMANGRMSSVRIEPDLKPSNVDADTSNPPQQEPDTPAVDNREKEKAACINNNIGIGNTFVWASRYSNTGSYASMIEDVDNPENNTCFVRVDIKSDDGRIDVSDIPSKYFEWGTGITCGEWADEDALRKRILAAKKSGRVWGTVAGTVGGAGLGVGIMELFGNRIIGGRVEGQKDLERKGRDADLLRSQLLALKRENSTQYNEFVRQVKNLQAECELDIWDNVPEKDLPDGCSFDFDTFLAVEGEIKG